MQLEKLMHRSVFRRPPPFSATVSASLFTTLVLQSNKVINTYLVSCFLPALFRQETFEVDSEILHDSHERHHVLRADEGE